MKHGVNVVDWESIFKKDLVFTDLKYKTREDFLSFIGEKMSLVPDLKNYNASKITTALLNRENESSTALGNGLAAPHARLDKIRNFLIAVALIPGGIDYGSFDGQVSELFFVIIGPKEERNTHVQILSTLASGLQQENIIDDIKNSKSAEELYNLSLKLVGAKKNKTAELKKKNSGSFEGLESYSVLEVIIQAEKYFNRILEELTSKANGSVWSTEASSAGSYLYRIPLFATMWSKDSPSNFMRTIHAIIMNDDIDGTLKQIDKIVKFKKNSGVLVSVRKLDLAIGSLDY